MMTYFLGHLTWNHRGAVVVRLQLGPAMTNSNMMKNMDEYTHGFQIGVTLTATMVHLDTVVSSMSTAEILGFTPLPYQLTSLLYLLTVIFHLLVAIIYSTRYHFLISASTLLPSNHSVSI